MAKIEQNICDAIEVIANNLISKAGYDRTIQATVLSCVNEATGKYKLKYQDNNIYAFTGDENKKYSRGTHVYVLVPGADMSKNKTIIGEVGNISAYDTEQNDIGQIVYERNSENLIQITTTTDFEGDATEEGIYSQYELNDGENKKQYCPQPTLENYNPSDKIRRVFIDEEAVSKYIEDSKYFFLGAYIRTDFEKDIITQGNYGMRLTIRCKDPNTNTNVSNVYTFDLRDMQGSPYYKKAKSYQYTVFPIPDNFVKIEALELFCEDFDLGEGGFPYTMPHDPDIIFTEVGLYTANKIEELNGGNGITLNFPNGRSILKGSGKKSLTVIANVTENSKLMADDQHSFYWFKKDMSVTSGGKEVNTDSTEKTPTGYCTYGGPGWYCLNTYENSVGWKPASNTFAFDVENQLLDIENQYKVVAIRTVGESIIKYEYEFKLFNFNYNFSADFWSPTYGKQFSLSSAIKNFDLNCRIFDNNNNHELPTGRDVSISQYCYQDFVFYWGVIINGIFYQGKQMCEFFTDLIFGDGFNTNTNVDGYYNQRKIKKVNLGIASLYSSGITFECTIYQIKQNVRETKKVNLKTISVRIGINENKKSRYELNIINGNQTFKYNVYNESPYINGEGAPKSLSLELIDREKGSAVDLENAIRQGKLSIDWQFPEDLGETFFVTPEELNGITVNDENTYYLGYSFKIIDAYKYERVDNSVIKVVVNYTDEEGIGYKIQAKTTFTFIKDGQYGTNGTEYIARIVGKWPENKDLPRWVTFEYRDYFEQTEQGIVYSKNSTIGSFNFRGHGQDEDPYVAEQNIWHELPFNVELVKNGVILDDTHISDIQWYMLTRFFGYPKKECRSNFVVKQYTDERDNTVKWGIKFYPDMYHTKDITPSNPGEDPDLHNDDDNIDEMRDLMPSNILCCKVTYLLDSEEAPIVGKVDEGKKNIQTIYAYLPIVKIVNRCLPNHAFSTMPKLNFDIESGYKEVVYDRSGFNDPSFVNQKNNFRIFLDGRLTSIEKGSFENVGVLDRSYIDNSRQYTWVRATNLTLEEEQPQITETSIDQQGHYQVDRIIRTIEANPTTKYLGNSSNNSILFRYVDYDNEDLDCRIDNYVHIPICFHLNQYGLGACNDWDGVTIELDNNDGTIMAPQVYAGLKEVDNSFTGIMIGYAKRPDQRSLHPGFFAFDHGDETVGIFADSGYTFFGKQNSSQIVIDPESGNNLGNYIYTTGFFTSNAFEAPHADGHGNATYSQEVGKVKVNALKYPNRYCRLSDYPRNNSYYGSSGMLIDLSQGGIYFGNGNFALDKDGNMTSIGGHIDNGRWKNSPIYSGCDGSDWAYIDLNPEFNRANLNEDIPSKGLYNNIVQFGTKFRISKQDGITLSNSGFFSNYTGNRFINFQNSSNDGEYLVFNGNIEKNTNDNVKIRNLNNPSSDWEVYGHSLNDYLILCSIGNDKSNIRDKNNIRFGVTKDGNIIAQKGKVGNFYINENYFTTKYTTFHAGDAVRMDAQDIILSSYPFTINNFPAVSYQMDINPLTGDYTDYFRSFSGNSTITVSSVRFALGEHFAITTSGNIYCTDIFADDFAADTIYVGDIHSEKIYGNYLSIKETATIETQLTSPRIYTRGIYGIDGSSILRIPSTLQIDDNVLNLPHTISVSEIVGESSINLNGGSSNRSAIMMQQDVRCNLSSYQTAYLPWMVAAVGDENSSPPQTLPDNFIYLIYDPNS